ncbi:hypothetical protein AOL_s00176g81 [Orbilia oligospora ATCC 24927]|uniref:F-box domain-containing protein n=1 Tax=Arthrobotrys oligospora (strain ATCC 24927 / CBS 115.81 / DSM 1491) TaxID=756982 RepID=G1XPV6_ARTOA|nr:hypothetical protein AOL_s00176g81 [Orbilia oligospora ATCC 24927]EGX44799.1 hypothetical protein AOL_s00176g81 [Orbilia oligospora ATCC 24927]
MSSSFPFLALPLELRNEIYKYLVYTPAQPVPYPLQLQNPPPYSPIFLNLSIFRVNKQVHSEATRIFYSTTTFTIRILLSDWQTLPTNTAASRSQFQVIYEDPWSEVIYTYDEEGRIWYTGFQSYGPGPNVCKFVEDTEIESTPSPRYRGLIRHIRVDMLDTRISMRRREIYKITDQARGRVRKILMPFAYRLQQILSGAGKDVEVEINLISQIFVKECPGGGNGNVLRFPSNYKQTSDVLGLYKELIETTWPYTIGPWRFKLNLPQEIEQEYFGLGKEVIKWCNENDEVSEEEKAEFRVMKTMFPYVWVMEKGHFVVMDENSDPWVDHEMFF